MLACLPASGDSTIPLLSCTQMNTGPQTWETTQKMRSTSYPTPAELDAYAKKVANNPLTIQIFPNSVKVPQRKHVRRTVNGLDTSSSQRHSPYPSHLSASTGLLAVLRAPIKTVVKEPSGTRGRPLHKAGMNLHNGPYGPQSTLNSAHPSAHLQVPLQPTAAPIPQQPPIPHPMGLRQTLHQTAPHSQALQHRGMSHPGPLQRQQSLSQLQTPQRPPYPPALQRQQSVPLSQQCAPPVPAQHLSHLHTLKHHGPAPQALLPPAQELRHISELNMQHPQPLQQTMTTAPPTGPPGGPPPGGPGAPPVMGDSSQQPPPSHYGPRKLPDADAPPNVTVSTSTIPLSMVSSLHQSRPGDLSNIVHQINQLCQARAGLGATSVCEGQIANPSPISRNLLINASSRVAHPPGSMPSCLVTGGLDKGPIHTPGIPLHSQPNVSVPNGMQSFHSEVEKSQHHLQRSWAQHQLAHMQQPPEGANPCKNPRLEPPAECSFAPPPSLNYPHKIPSSAQSFPLKHPDKPRASPPLSLPGTSLPYMNGQYVQRPWGHQDLAAFQGPRSSTSERIPGAKYRPGNEDQGGQPKLLPNMDFLGADFQLQGFRDQSVDVMVPTQEPGGGGVHGHHPAYR